MEQTRRQAPRTAFKPGQSGNPKGRPKGSGAIGKLRAAISDALPDVLEAMTQKALAGDVSAARLLLERVVPPLKPEEQALPLALPDGTLTDQGRAVLAAVAAGELAPLQGSALLGAIGTLARVAEVDELERRIKALEGQRDEGH